METETSDIQDAELSLTSANGNKTTLNERDLKTLECTRWHAPFSVIDQAAIDRVSQALNTYSKEKYNVVYYIDIEESIMSKNPTTSLSFDTDLKTSQFSMGHSIKLAFLIDKKFAHRDLTEEDSASEIAILEQGRRRSSRKTFIDRPSVVGEFYLGNGERIVKEQFVNSKSEIEKAMSDGVRDIHDEQIFELKRKQFQDQWEKHTIQEGKNLIDLVAAFYNNSSPLERLFRPKSTLQKAQANLELDAH